MKNKLKYLNLEIIHISLLIATIIMLFTQTINSDITNRSGNVKYEYDISVKLEIRNSII